MKITRIAKAIAAATTLTLTLAGCSLAAGLTGAPINPGGFVDGFYHGSTAYGEDNEGHLASLDLNTGFTTPARGFADGSSIQLIKDGKAYGLEYGSTANLFIADLDGITATNYQVLPSSVIFAASGLPGDRNVLNADNTYIYGAQGTRGFIYNLRTKTKTNLELLDDTKDINYTGANAVGTINGQIVGFTTTEWGAGTSVVYDIATGKPTESDILAGCYALMGFLPTGEMVFDCENSVQAIASDGTRETLLTENVNHITSDGKYLLGSNTRIYDIAAKHWLTFTGIPEGFEDGTYPVAVHDGVAYFRSSNSGLSSIFDGGTRIWRTNLSNGTIDN